jgi:hypothetical protein
MTEWYFLALSVVDTAISSLQLPGFISSHSLPEQQTFDASDI